jgi:hypothetical protein
MNNATKKEEGKMSKPFFTIVAVNNDVDTCSCCGRTDLKRVAWVAMTVDGIEHAPAPFGTTCAANAVAHGRGGNEFVQAVNKTACKDAIKRAAKSKKAASVWVH